MSRLEFHLYPTDLKFSVFSSSDAKELSVVKIVTGLTFNALEHALPGGLYDPAMGRYSKSADPCATCLSTMACPGHFGHIELNSLVYNPFFTKLVHDILRFTCLSCFRLQLTDHVRTIVELQLNLVDAGFVVEAQDIEVFRSEFVAKSAETSVKTEAGAYLHPKIAEMYDLLEREGSRHDINTRTSSGIRSSIVRSLLQNTVSKKCVHCSENLKRVKYSYGKLIMNFSKADMQIFYDQGQIENRASKSSNTPLLPDECRQILRKVYENYASFFNLLFPVLSSSSKNVKSPMDIFFMNVVPVTPSQARPVNIARGQISEHPQTIVYRNIIEANTILNVVMKSLKNDLDDLPSDSGAIVKSVSGETSHEKLYNAWQDLQTKVDQLLDINLGREKSYMQGLKQILEKKDGLMRKHMMGKRVNYAARTVITPDPNINVDELGIPDIFAKKLSYPVPVTPWNVSELRKLVINGPDEHPGANYVEDQKGFKMLIPPGDPAKRESMAKLLLTNPVDGIKVVHRHLRNGDILLLNRQPTLHRPSIMAHKARILQGEKTFRLHYSNCKAYNADFDGDEMNAHFPQNEVCRSEAYNLVNVSNQYLVPKDGTPLGGLIQDHVVSGVKLSIRGRFFNREDYQQLVYQGLSHRKRNIKLLPPTIVKPFKLWSGKQILSTIILNTIPNDSVPLNLTSTAKISPKAWQTDLPRTWTSGGSSLDGIQMTESEVIIRGGELVVGVLDKTHYGATPYGLVHCMYELYGGNCSTQLLTSFAKLLTNFLQRDGFTLGVQDILVTSRADKQRRSIIKNSRTIGNDIVADVLGMVPDSTLAEKVEESYAFNPKFRTMLDRKYKSVLDGFTNEINRVCHPAGLLHKFPFNNLQLMILSGAKGSTVNAMQISCLLGQIELEGKRPPLMISGKSLPSFATFETSPKSGGFIDGRFMTGIQPQDFFFHCMAGREGLIDTAVKTSRSGYLQRCLIKHLEGLNVNYDLTVRDSDNCVIQFMYGEDGMDISKCRFLNSKGLKFLDENSHVILNNSQLDMNNDFDTKSIRKHGKKLKSWIKKNGDSKAKRRVSAFLQFSSELREQIEVENSKKRSKKTGRLKIDEKLIKLWCKADAEKKESYTKKFTRCPDPLISKFNPDNVFGSISEYLEDLMKSYFMEHPERQDEFTKVMHVKSIRSVVNPGEPVGLLAAQSVGEPSTQMTLNTFHFAGRGEMNVTLGIPRLREILMLASANIKTPSMDIPFKSNQLDKAEKLRIKLNRVTVADVLQYINVKISMTLRPERAYQYKLYFKFLPRKAYKDDFGVKPNEIIKYMSTKFFNSMFKAILRSSKNKLAVIELESDTNKKSQEDDDDGEIDIDPSSAQPVQIDTSEDEQEGEDDDATDIRLKKKQKDENDYDDPDVEEEIEDIRDDEDLEPDMLEDHDISGELDEDETINAVLNNEHVNSFTYDKEHYMWCNMAFNLPMKYKNLDISNLLRQVAKNSVIWEVNRIKRAITYTQQDQLILKTEGINIVEMFKYNKLLELNRLYSNDIHAIAKTYGIEAASRVVVKEVQNVFKVYGITVDPRHLMLIADYMTFEGTFKPLSRKGMEFCTSPLQQMSFESSLQFLKSATINGVEDSLSSPSSRLMVGLPVKSGTGSFSLLAKIAV